MQVLTAQFKDGGHRCYALAQGKATDCAPSGSCAAPGFPLLPLTHFASLLLLFSVGQ